VHKLGTVCEHSCTLFSCAFEFSFTLLLENTLVPDFLLPADRLLSSFSAAAGRLDVALGLVARAAEPHKLLPEETQVCCAVLCCAVRCVSVRVSVPFSAAAGRLDIALGLVARAAEPHKLLPEETQVCAVLCCAVLYVILLCICAQF